MMFSGGGGHRRSRRAAAVLIALTLLPVAVVVSTSHASAATIAWNRGAATASGLLAQDLDVPSSDAVQRGQASHLFAPFSWDGLVASGPFLRFDYLADSGSILDYLAVNGTQMSVLAESIQIEGFRPVSPPLLSAATFTITGPQAIIVAHDEPMALLEIRTLAEPQNVTIRFPATSTSLQVSSATAWPAASLSFTYGSNTGRIIVGRGGLSVNGSVVTAAMSADDYLALRAVPGSVEHAAERTAILDAFASGRLAAEYDLVAVSSGGWLENSAQYHAAMGRADSSAVFNRASLNLDLPTSRSGLVLLAFDPTTMPADSQHSLVVEDNGTVVPETSDPFASLFALPGSSDHVAYVRLAMNATVLVVFVPDLSSVDLQVTSVAIPPPGIDRPTQMGIVSAMFVVAVAAAIMFRRQRR